MPKFKVGQRIRRLVWHEQIATGEIVYVLKNSLGADEVDVSRTKGGPAVTIPNGKRAMHFLSEKFEAVGICGTAPTNRKLLLC